MGKKIPTAVLDAQLDLCEGDTVHVCTAEPTTYAEASATYQLASQAITGGNYAKAAGDTSGRKNTCTPPTQTAVDNTGIGNHVVVTNGTTIKQITTCPAVSLTQGGKVDINPWAHEVQDAA